MTFLNQLPQDLKLTAVDKRDDSVPRKNRFV